MEQTEKTDQLDKALLKIHEELGPIIETDSENQFFKKANGKKHQYASLAGLLSKLKPILLKNGSIVEQFRDQDSMTTRITHVSSGQWKLFRYPIAVKDPSDPQSIKSAHTYAKRDSLESFFSVAESDADDDGNQAAGKQSKTSTSTSTKTSSKKTEHKPSEEAEAILSNWRKKGDTQPKLHQIAGDDQKKISALPAPDRQWLADEYLKLADTLDKDEKPFEMDWKEEMENSFEGKEKLK
jgi:hypothetical protein